ncbi:MAG: DUF4149 domain-containing protein [Aquificae bacterium]|nr:DUF4149 domain-containing protein [Aquificota bacterium]
MQHKLILTVSSAFLGISVFFSFLVAPTLFRVLGTHQAGKVVEEIFPYYFGLATLSAVAVLILGWPLGKFFRTLASLNFLLSALEFFYMNPTMHALKRTNYELFLKYHGLSMFVNLLIILFNFVFVAIIILKGRGEK